METSDDLYSAANPTPKQEPPQHSPPEIKTQSGEDSAASTSTTNGHMAVPYTEDHPEMVEEDSKHQCVSAHHTLLDPLQTPCGHRICARCLDIILDSKESAPCPAREDTCVTLTRENVFPDYGARREMGNLEVYCLFRIGGCPAVVQYKYFKKHIEECDFKPLDCKYKLFGCRATLTKDKYDSHVKTCNHEPTKCQKCGLEIPKCDQKDHLSNECSKGIARCPHNCGETNIPRDRGSCDAMEIHNREQKALHLNQTMAAFEQKDTQIQTLSQDLAASQEIINNLKTDVQTCNSELDKFSRIVTNQEQKIRDMTKMLAKQDVGINKLEVQSSHLARKDQLARHEKELTLLQTKASSQEAAVSGLLARPTSNIPEAVWTKMSTYERQIAIQQVRLAEADLRFHCLETTNYSGVLYWKVSEYSRKKGEAVSGRTLSIYSQPFFTSRYGYKMCARIYLNGDGQGKGTHLSVFFLVMRGEFDALLKWPFRQKVTLTLIDQSGRRHVSDTFRPDPTSSSFKKPETEMNIASGCPLFAAHSVVEKAPFLMDDTLFIKVTVDTSNLEI